MVKRILIFLPCYQNKTYVVDPESMSSVFPINYLEGNPTYKCIKIYINLKTRKKSKKDREEE